MNITTLASVPDSESSTLFNPAFCAVLLNKATASFEAKSASKMPLTFAFLILPSALHKATRDALPSTSGASMWTWLQANPLLLKDFTERVQTIRPYTSAAVTYGMSHGVLLGTAGVLSAGALRRRPRHLHPTDDWLACMKAAAFLGRWFSGVGTDEATTLARWGVRP